MVFEQIVQTMVQMDVFYLFFPWLLVLAVTYGVLDKFDYFEEDTINAVVAIAVSFMAIGGMILFVPRTMFPQFAAALAFTVFGFIGLLVLLALGGYDIEEIDDMGKKWKLGILGLGVSIAVGVAAYQLGAVELVMGFLGQSGGGSSNGPGLLEQVVYLVFLLLIVGAVTRSASGGGED